MAAQRLVGRETELRLATAAVDRLADGVGGLILITGEPGIGKSALAEAVLDEARARGAGTSWATAWQHAGAPPLWPWEQTLRQLGLDTALAPVTGTGTGTDEADAARFRQFEAVDAALAGQVTDAPLVLVLDDLQWADVATLRLLAFVAGTSRRRPLLLIGTYRPDELDPGELAALERLGTTIPLAGLDESAVGSMLVDAIGEQRGREAAGLVMARSGGNPLFVRELARLLTVSGRVGVAERAVPPAVAAVIQRRLARQPDQVVRVLQAGSVLGRRFDPGVLARLLDDADAARFLDGAEEAGLVQARARGDYEFVHDLVLEVVRDSLQSDHARTLHARAAELLAEQAGADASLSARIATHLEGAGRGDEAAGQWQVAGAWALRMLAYEEAAGCFARARRLSARAGDDAVDLLLAEADARVCAGDLATSRELFGEAAARAARRGDAHRLAAAVLGIGAGVTGWEVPMSDASYVRLVTAALTMLGDDEVRLRSALLARLSVARATPETQAESRVLAEQALALADEVGDPVLQAHALAALCDASAGPGHAERRRALAERIVTLGRAAGDRGVELLGHRFAVVALLELGDLTAFDAEVGAFQQLAASLRQPLLDWYAPLFRGMRALLRGHVQEAERYADEVAAAAERTGSLNAAMLASTLLLGVFVQTGRPVPEGLVGGIFDVDPAAWSSYAAALGFEAVCHGDLAEAGRLLHLHSDNGFVHLGDDAEYLATLMYFGRTAVAVGDQDSIAWLYDALTPYAGLWIVDGIAAVCWGPVELELGRLAGALGRIPAAREHLASARAKLTAAGAALLLDEVGALELEVGVRPTTAAPAQGAAWQREGGLWSLSYAGRTVRLRHAKGLADLARLLARPGQELHVLDLLGDGVAPPAEGAGADVLDPRARTAYRDRLAQLEDEIDRATLDADRGRLEKAEEEKAFLLAELGAAFGLGGRSRRLGDPAERARKAVTTRVRLAIERIAPVHPDLAAHLRNSVRTGIFCSYQPEISLVWQLSSGDATPDVAPRG